MKIFSILLSAVFILFFILFLFLSQISPLKSTDPKSLTQVPETEIYFNPKTLSHGCYSKKTADIYIDSHKNSVSSVQIELQYDPFAITDFSISPSEDNFFGTKNSYQISLNETRAEYGRASLSLENSEGFSEKSGVGKIGTVNFTANPVASTSTVVTFINKTNVLGRSNRDSRLKTTIPLTINCL